MSTTIRDLIKGVARDRYRIHWAMSDGDDHASYDAAMADVEIVLASLRACAEEEARCEFESTVVLAEHRAMRGIA